MSYVAVKGGEQAIRNAEILLQARRRGDRQVAELSLDQIQQQLALAVDRVMAEGSLYDPELAALAIKQAWGDLVEAIFLVRAYRTTLPRLYTSEPLVTSQITLQRRISGIFKDVPGGQYLGSTFDYTHRLLDFTLAAEGDDPGVAPEADPGPITQPHSDRGKHWPHITEFLEREGLLQVPRPMGQVDPQRERLSERAHESEDPQLEVLSDRSDDGSKDHQSQKDREDPKDQKDPKDQSGLGAPANRPVFDLTRQPLTFPVDRDARLQNLARADEGFLLSLAYATQRGYGDSHPFAGEIRVGEVEVVICPDELGFEVVIGEITITEVDMVNQFQGSQDQPPQFTRGYGLTFGHNERKAMAMALVDRSMRAEEFGEPIQGPAQDVEFVLLHSDNVEAQGFVQHLKLPHYIDFQAELNLIRSLRQHQGISSQSRSSSPSQNTPDTQPGSSGSSVPHGSNGSQALTPPTAETPSGSASSEQTLTKPCVEV